MVEEVETGVIYALVVLAAMALGGGWWLYRLGRRSARLAAAERSVDRARRGREIDDAVRRLDDDDLDDELRRP